MGNGEARVRPASMVFTRVFINVDISIALCVTVS